jgi:hypothetical protein
MYPLPFFRCNFVVSVIGDLLFSLNNLVGGDVYGEGGELLAAALRYRLGFPQELGAIAVNLMSNA